MFLKFWLHWICFEFQSCFTRKSWVIVELLLQVLGLWNFESIRKHREIKQATRGTGAGAFSSKFKGPISATFYFYFYSCLIFLAHLDIAVVCIMVFIQSNLWWDDPELCCHVYFGVYKKRGEEESLMLRNSQSYNWKMLLKFSMYGLVDI